MNGRQLLVPFVVFLLLACDGDPPSYSVEAEREAVARLTGTWTSADGTTELSICEDTERELDDDSCAYGYQLRSSGGTRLSDASGKRGCPGGCSFALVAAFRVELKQDDAVTRFAALGGYGEDDGAPDATPAIYWPQGGQGSVSLGEDGRLELQQSSVDTVVLTRTGPATCE